MTKSRTLDVGASKLKPPSHRCSAVRIECLASLRWRLQGAVILALSLLAVPPQFLLFQDRAKAEQAEPGRGAACTLSAPERRRVAEIIDGETLALADGTELRLIGAKAPAAPPNWRGSSWPLVSEAKAALTELASGQEVELRFGGTRVDRHGRSLAHVLVVRGDERVWLQSELVGRGLARVYSFPDNRACVRELLAREAEARAHRRGVWSASAYRVLEADALDRLRRLTRSYQIVEGVVAATAEVRGRLYLNFAEDWRRDFTVVLERKDRQSIEAEGFDLQSLVGKRLRVRGWLEWWNGPMIRATHAEQLERVVEPQHSQPASEGLPAL